MELSKDIVVVEPDKVSGVRYNGSCSQEGNTVVKPKKGMTKYIFTRIILTSVYRTI